MAAYGLKMVKPTATVAGAMKAGIWSALDLVVRQGLQFVISVILARLLTPKDFGVIAILTFFTSLSIVFVQGGLASALIQRSETSHEEESATFWFNVLASAGVALTLALAGGTVARFYDQPTLQTLVLAAGAQIILSAFGSVHGALLARNLRFDQTLITGLVASVVSGIAGIAAAIAGWGAWALATQMIVAAATGTIAMWILFPWRPSLRFRPGVLRPLLGFGSWLSLSSVLDIMYSQGSALAMGKIYGLRDLGLFNRAASTQQLPTTVISSIIGRVALPLFAQRSDEPEAFKRGLQMAIALVMVVNVPLMVGLALLAGPVTVALFGDQWLPAAPILSILALSGILYPLHVLNLQTLLAQGGSARFFRIEVIKKLVGFAFVVAGALTGVIGLAWAQVALSIIAFPLNAAPMGERLGYGTVAQLRDLTGLAVPTLVMVAVVKTLLETISLSPLGILLTTVPAGAAAYAAAGLLLRRRIFLDAASLILNHLPGRQSR